MFIKLQKNFFAWEWDSTEVTMNYRIKILLQLVDNIRIKIKIKMF
jgi:hypothetical protein